MNDSDYMSENSATDLAKPSVLQRLMERRRKSAFDYTMSLANDFSWYLLFLGMKPEDQILVHLPDGLQFSVVRIGSLKAGVKICRINDAANLRSFLTTHHGAWPRAIVISSNACAETTSVLTQLPISNVIEAKPADLQQGLRRIAGNAFNCFADRSRKPHHHNRRVSLRGALWAGNLVRTGTLTSPLVNEQRRPDRA